MEINTEKLYKDIEFKKIFSFEYHKDYRELEIIDPEAFEKIQNSYQEDLNGIDLFLERNPTECNIVYAAILKNYKNSFFSIKTLQEKIEYKEFETGVCFKVAESRVKKIVNDLIKIGLVALLPLNQREKIYKVNGAKENTLNIDNPAEVRQKIIELKTWYYYDKIERVPDLYEIINVLCSKYLIIDSMDAIDFSQKIKEFGKKIQEVITLKHHEVLFLHKNYKHFKTNDSAGGKITLDIITEKLVQPPQRLLKNMINSTNFSVVFKNMHNQKLYVTKPLRLEGFNYEEWGQIFDLLDVKLDMIGSSTKW